MKFGSKLNQRGQGGATPRSNSRSYRDSHESIDDEIGENSPYIKDFAFYKAKFSNKHKEIKVRLREFGTIVE
jgi:hypothetical protein